MVRPSVRGGCVNGVDHTTNTTTHRGARGRGGRHTVTSRCHSSTRRRRIGSNYFVLMKACHLSSLRRPQQQLASSSYCTYGAVPVKLRIFNCTEVVIFTIILTHVRSVLACDYTAICTSCVSRPDRNAATLVAGLQVGVRWCAA